MPNSFKKSLQIIKNHGKAFGILAFVMFFVVLQIFLKTHAISHQKQPTLRQSAEDYFAVNSANLGASSGILIQDFNEFQLQDQLCLLCFSARICGNFFVVYFDFKLPLILALLQFGFILTKSPHPHLFQKSPRAPPAFS